MNKNIPRPVPQGRYHPAVRHGDLIYTSGFTPRSDGKLVHSGKVKAGVPAETYRDAVRMAAQNAIWAVQNCLQDGEKVLTILQLNVFLNAEPDFTNHAKMADYASDLLVETFGISCIGSRAAIGVATLPSDASVEITIVAAVVQSGAVG